MSGARYLVGRSDMDRFFYTDRADAEAIAHAYAEDYPGETVYVYEVTLRTTVTVEEVTTPSSVTT